MMSSCAMVPRSITLCFAAVISALNLALCPIKVALAETNIDEPFGLFTVVVPEAPLSATWKELLLQVSNDLSIVAHCHSDPQSCSSPAALKFLAIVKEGEQYKDRVQIGHINRAANFAIRALASAHVDDEWRSPLVALARGVGDCKHYAVLKYAALRGAGVAPDALKIVVVEVRSTHQQHAVVAVRIQNHWLLLDNHTLTLIESSIGLDYYDPLYALDEHGVRQFALPSHPAQIAESLQRRVSPPIKNN
jgi:predicted transglutaminase-like cysteine proteinase